MRNIWILLIIAAPFLAACGTGKAASGQARDMRALQDSLQMIADSSPGEIGIALITDRGDTLTVNDTAKYPLMSVFKLHQAIALCHKLEAEGNTLDSLSYIPRRELNPDTWSPMLSDYKGDTIAISLRDLLRYTLVQSDNNASNYLFGHFQPVEDVDSFMAGILPRESFRLTSTEEEMWRDHSLCYRNRTSPLGAAILINRLYTDSLTGADNLIFLRSTLQECKTGTDRIVAPLRHLPGVKTGHKTGSGYREGGILAAHNDVAYVELPDGRKYALAVFVKDFHGDEEEAARVIARISATVLHALQ